MFMENLTHILTLSIVFIHHYCTLHVSPKIYTSLHLYRLEKNEKDFLCKMSAIIPPPQLHVIHTM
jgi:hypothetical protein